MIDPDNFLVELDGMIESTEEFIGDDGLRADDERIHDLSALLRVRDLWTETFKPQESDTPMADADTRAREAFKATFPDYPIDPDYPDGKFIQEGL